MIGITFRYLSELDMAAMFKKEKDLTERSRALLKNKETKKLTAEVSRFSGISRTSMVLDEVECKL